MNYNNSDIKFVYIWVYIWLIKIIISIWNLFSENKKIYIIFFIQAMNKIFFFLIIVLVNVYGMRNTISIY